ncbi:phage head morphogenesis protein, partial [Sebaldella sp. S0638]|nr:phage head morphogenesis protein [Sebaldella sp. S0638]
REKILQIENLEEDKMNKKADTISKLIQSGYEIEDTELQEIFGYKTLKKKEQQQQNSPFTEFSKKNTEDSNKKTLEYLERLRKRVVPEISKKIKGQIKNITSIEDIKNIDTGIKDHENSLILSELWGSYLTIKDRSKISEYKKKSEFAIYSEIDLQDIFNMTFNEAINWLLNREPQMYDQIQKVIDKYRTEYFWIKQSTDLEVTKTLYAELLKNLELGQTFEDFKKNIDIESLGFGK